MHGYVGNKSFIATANEMMPRSPQGDITQTGVKKPNIRDAGLFHYFLQIRFPDDDFTKRQTLFRQELINGSGMVFFARFQDGGRKSRLVG